VFHLRASSCEDQDGVRLITVLGVESNPSVTGTKTRESVEYRGSLRSFAPRGGLPKGEGMAASSCGRLGEGEMGLARWGEGKYRLYSASESIVGILFSQ